MSEKNWVAYLKITNNIQQKMEFYGALSVKGCENVHMTMLGRPDQDVKELLKENATLSRDEAIQAAENEAERFARKNVPIIRVGEEWTASDAEPNSNGRIQHYHIRIEQIE